MIPFSIYTFIALVLAFGAGFFVGKSGGKSRNQQNVGRFDDSEASDKIREKGREVVQARIEKRKTRIMERAKREGKITNDDVEDLFCISDSTARNYLNELEEEGKLTQVGESGRGVYYTPLG